jgi:hypothetical protein
MAQIPTFEALMSSVRNQKALLPEVYGSMDFDQEPERFTIAVNDETELRDPARRDAVLARHDLTNVMRAYTYRADPVADAYAAAGRSLGMRRLVEMLVRACDQGVDSVADAPPELGAFISEMEAIPEWLDMQLVDEGAKMERNMVTNLLPYIMQVGFVGTFMNKYSALPMAMTGTLSNSTVKRRILDTSNFMVTTTLPGALQRFGPGFKSAAMVRLMHSMVRVNLLTRGRWDAKVYGMPIPQIDQMPAGLALVYFMTKDMLNTGRTEFNHSERARVEFARYRCYLLGLPEELLPSEPQGIVDIWDARGATLRQKFDNDICLPMVKATLQADLASDRSLSSRMRQALSMSFGKRFFLAEYAGGDAERAAFFGVVISLKDRALILAAATLIASRMAAYGIAQKIPGLAQLADRRLVMRMKRHLVRYGHAEFVSDASTYQPKMKKAA